MWLTLIFSATAGLFLAWTFFALGMPFMFPLFQYAVLNSTFVTLRQGGIRWRETFYPLDALRTRTVR